MALRPLSFSASKAALLLQCPRPFIIAPAAEPAPLTPAQQQRAGNFREAGEYGTRFHACMADWAKCGVYDPTAVSDWRHVQNAIDCLCDWMKNDPDWAPLSIIEAEIPYASRFSGDVLYSRITKFQEQDHVYDLTKDEWPGTADLLLRARDGQCILLDWKTSKFGTWDEPDTVPQLQTLALQLGASGVAIGHAPREGIPVIYSSYIEPATQRGFAEALRVRLSQVEHGDAQALEGSLCPRCPLFRECAGGARWRASKTKRAAKAAEVAGDDT